MISTTRTHRPPSVLELLQGTGAPPKFPRSRLGGTYRNPRALHNTVNLNQLDIQLALPPTANAFQLYEFYTKLEDKLRKLGNSGFVSRVLPSRSRGTTFVVKVLPSNITEVVNELRNMPEVREVTEELISGDSPIDHSKRFNVILAS